MPISSSCVVMIMMMTTMAMMIKKNKTKNLLICLHQFHWYPIGDETDCNTRPHGTTSNDRTLLYHLRGGVHVTDHTAWRLPLKIEIIRTQVKY